MGCKNMSWPFYTSLTWCLCDDDLCNGASMGDMNQYRAATNPYENTILDPYDKSKVQKKMVRNAKEGDDEDSGIYDAHYQMQETSHGFNGERARAAADGQELIDPGVQIIDPTYPGPATDPVKEPQPKQKYDFRDIYFPPQPNSPDFEASRKDQERSSKYDDGEKVGDAFLRQRAHPNEFYKQGQSYGWDQKVGGSITRDPYYPYEDDSIRFSGPLPPHVAHIPYEGYAVDIEHLKPLPFPRDLGKQF